MVRMIKKRAKTAALPPGTLVHIEEQELEKTRISLINYDESRFLEKDAEKVEECSAFRDRSGVTWIAIEGVHEINILEKLTHEFGFHPLVQEDIVHTIQRPKADQYETYLFIVLRSLHYNEEEELKSEQVSLALGQNYVVLFQEKKSDIFDPIRKRIKNAKSRIRMMGADFLAYSIIDAVVDNYFISLENIGEKIEDLEDELLIDPTPETLLMIHTLKREIILLRRTVWPLREVIRRLEKQESPFVQDTTQIYLRDVYDHTIHVAETIATFGETLSAMLEVYLSSITLKTNEVMKVLTIIATIFIPLTFLTGIYGMNFEHMPELSWSWSYPLVWSVMFTTALLMLAFFKKKDWL
ncbi:MAG: magnesium/cobalt transporter CorA [Candidatus Hodarchaeales archaeon]|jgi:magnesium transporter